jgi:hypothetical protein
MASSPAAPGLFFCFVATLLLVFVRIPSSFVHTSFTDKLYFPGIRIGPNLECYIFP